VLTRSFVERLGGHVNAIGPDDGADLRVDADLGEEIGIGPGQGAEDEMYVMNDILLNTVTS
jgi:hypothetical protein